MTREAARLVPTWGAEDLDPREIRADVEAMVDAVTAALVDHLGEGLAGLWFKGSAQKRWDLPIDYVPEVGDVDIHVRLSLATRARVADVNDVLAIHAAMDTAFRRARPRPAHVPRVQLVPVDEVEAMPGYVPAPASTVRTLHGPSHAGPGAVDQPTVRASDAARLVQLADPGELAKATTDIIEQPGHHLYWALRKINWRVSPVGPLVLSVSGTDYETAWSANRTRVVELLSAVGFADLPRTYVGYYEAAWRFWRSGWTDGDAGRQSFAHAIATIETGRAVGEAAR